MIVDDYVYSGSMYLSQPVSEQGDPIDALAQAYFDSYPCPTKHTLNENWGDYVLSMAKQAKVDGVIVLLPKYCEIYAFDYRDMGGGTASSRHTPHNVRGRPQWG